MHSNNWMDGSRKLAHDLTIRAARSSQALTISALDRLVPRSGLRRGLLSRSFELTSAVVGEPAALVDEQYELVERLTRLHREFAQRLFEVLEPPGPPADAGLSGPPLAPVVRIQAR